MLHKLRIMSEQTAIHHYLLPNGIVVSSQKEGCEIMGIGRNAFRNRVKNGNIEKFTDDRPNGYGNEDDR